MPTTIRDIARQLNLSHTTVSRVLNNRDAIRIPEATRDRVRAAARELGYRPNLSARALVTGRSKLIALQLYRLDSPFAMEVARRLQALAWEDGYEVLVHEFLGDNTNLRSVVDGVLLLDRIFSPEDSLPRAEDQIPHVALGAFHVDTIDSVGVDLYTPGLEVMQLLLKAGCKRIAFLGQSQMDPEADGRMAAYRAAMQEAGLPPIPIEASDHARPRSSGYAAMRTFLSGKIAPEAIFCKSDELAVGCYRALRERGLRIPDDVAVIGCDGLDEGLFLPPPLTTLSQPIEALCQQGWQFLKRRMEDRDLPRQQAILSATLTLRESHN
jgi:LacI family transcriptional regulator